MKALLRAFSLVALSGLILLPARAGEAWPTAGSAPYLGQIVAVVRGDGLMVPLAAAPPDSASWVMLGAHAPAGGDTETIRILHRASIPNDGWTLHMRGGSRRMPFNVIGMDTVPARCERQEVLKTSILGVGSTDYPRGAAGIATHGNVAVLNVENVVRDPDEASRDAERLVRQMTQAFDSQLATQRFTGLSDIPAEQRAATEVQITKLFRVRGDNGASSYYFQAQKSHGGMRTYVRGLVRSDRTTLSLVDVSAGVDRGGETAGIDSEVLGAVRYGPDQYWVLENFAYEGGFYSLVGAKGGVQVGVSTGGC